MAKFDIFAIRSTSAEARETVISVNEASYTVLEWQAIIGRLYAKAARFRNKTKKHAAWQKAASVRSLVNKGYRDQYGEE